MPHAFNFSIQEKDLWVQGLSETPSKFQNTAELHRETPLKSKNSNNKIIVKVDFSLYGSATVTVFGTDKAAYI